MTRSELIEIIANRENSGTEFKSDTGLRPERLAREIVALANFQGGRILIGVEDDGEITGVQRDDLEHWVMDAVFGRKVHPMILPFYEEVRVDERRRVAVVTITQGASKPYVVRHDDREEIYVRVGTTSRRATREQQARLFAVGGMLHAELLPVSGSGLRDLDRARLEDYLVTVVEDDGAPVSDEAWGRRLCGLGFMTGRQDGPPVCTIAGLVLFGRRPRRLLRQAGIRWMAFEGKDRTYRALDDRVLDAPLVALRRGSPAEGREIAEKGLIEIFADCTRPFVSEDADEVDATLRRDRQWRYPREVMREAVVNALAHRDWTRNEEIEVVSHADRLEVSSPGALPNTMTVEKMIAGQRSPRNPTIVDVLRNHGYVDARGMGVRNKIIPLLRAQNGVDPEFEATEDYLRLTMPRGRADARSETGGPHGGGGARFPARREP